MRLGVLAAFLFLLITTGTRAQSPVAGTWIDATFTLELRTNGDNLTGGVTEGQLGRHEISNGRVNGSKLGFTTDAKLNGKDVVLEWNGEVVGDELTLTRVIRSGPPRRGPGPFNGPFVLRRSR
jgi:hypothetical protein